MNHYATLADFKAQMPVNTADEAAVNQIIGSASRFIDIYCRRFFYCLEGTKYWDGGKTMIWPTEDILSLSALYTDPDGDGSWAYTWATTDYLLYPLNKFPKDQIQLSNASTHDDFATGLLNAVKGVGVFGFGDGSSRGATPYLISGAVVNTGGISDSATTHALATGKGALFSAGMTVRIDNEQLYITGVATDTLSFERGVNGTTAAAHLAAAVIYIYQTHDIIKEATLIQSMKWWKRRESAFTTKIGDQTTGIVQIYKGLDPDVQDMLNDSQMRKVI